MTSVPLPTLTPTEFEELVQDIRPELHRYVAHMIGSVIDAEDVVQETLIKAYDSLAMLNARSNVRGWLFRIAHNKAIDQLRRYTNQPLELLDEYPMTAEPDQPLEEKELTTLALSIFLKLGGRKGWKRYGCHVCLFLMRNRFSSIQRLQQPLTRKTERKTILICLVSQYIHNAVTDHLRGKRHPKPLQVNLFADPFACCKSSQRRVT